MDMAIFAQTIISSGIAGTAFGYAWYMKKHADPKDKTMQFDLMKLLPFVMWGAAMSVAIAFGSEYIGADINVVATGPLGVWSWTMVQHLVKWAKARI